MRDTRGLINKREGATVSGYMFTNRMDVLKVYDCWAVDKIES